MSDSLDRDDVHTVELMNAAECTKRSSDSVSEPSSGMPAKTVHAPQSPSPQPILVPTRPRCRRNSTSDRKTASPAIASRFPFT